MPITHSKIKLAFRKVLLDLAPGVTGQPNIPTAIQWEGEELSPPEGTPWLAEYYQIVDESLVATNLLGAEGIYQINVFGPLGKGQTLVESIAERIKKAYAPGSINNVALGVEIAIDKSTRGTANTEGGAASPRQDFRWLMIPVLVNWRSYAPE